jgi:hypothetical protein
MFARVEVNGSAVSDVDRRAIEAHTRQLFSAAGFQPLIAGARTAECQVNITFNLNLGQENRNPRRVGYAFSAMLTPYYYRPPVVVGDGGYGRSSRSNSKSKLRVRADIELVARGSNVVSMSGSGMSDEKKAKGEFERQERTTQAVNEALIAAFKNTIKLVKDGVFRPQSAPSPQASQN